MTLGSPLIPPAGLADKIAVGSAKADNGAARRTARRTARRVSRRQARYYNALPAGCVKVFVAGVSYFQCGTVYYQPVVHQGANVYVIVTP
ncbi:hypothetical protein [Roseibium sp.]|uniref:hypothetical protein n=1 Tax=Roseibium sp. TaxID=1936156 RepID=UPI003BAF57FC